VSPHLFLTSGLGGGVRSESHSGRFNPGQELRYPFTTMLGGAQRPSVPCGGTYVAPVGCSLDTVPTEPSVPVTKR